MVGQRPMPSTTKPSRSDEVLDPNQQIQITEEIRAQFDSLTPKRPPKPTRSDPDADEPPPCPAVPGAATTIPELEKFQSLKCQPVFPSRRGVVTDEEFVETTYYDGLISMDKQHHTTGTGFIRLVREGGANDENGRSDYDLHRKLDNGGAERKVMALGMRGNPAMNDWIPTVEDVDQGNHHLSSKPIRSG